VNGILDGLRSTTRHHTVLPRPDINIPLLRKAVEWVEEQDAKPEAESAWMQAGTVIVHPERFGRTCGTAYCLAGYIAAMVTGQERPQEPISTAVEALGLDDAFAVQGLFWGDNNAADIRWIAEQLAGEPL
jgi:hypothetical protein